VVKISYCWYIPACNGQHRVLLHPRVIGGSEFPNLVGRRSVDSESAENIELVIEDRKATGKSYPVTVTRPGSSNGVNRVCNRIITKNATTSRRLSSCRAAYAVNVGRSRVSEYAASHVADLIVREGR